MVKHHIFLLLLLLLLLLSLLLIIFYFFYIKTNLKEMGGERDDVDDGNDTNIRELYYLQQRVC